MYACAQQGEAIGWNVRRPGGETAVHAFCRDQRHQSTVAIIFYECRGLRQGTVHRAADLQREETAALIDEGLKRTL